MPDPVFCGINLADYLIRMEEFHGFRSPGLLPGGIMVDMSLKELGTTPYLNVVTETVVCLPDAVQLLTPCTIGNGFLQRRKQTCWAMVRCVSSALSRTLSRFLPESARIVASSTPYVSVDPAQPARGRITTSIRHQPTFLGTGVEP
jgi:hypothetical protein